MDAHLLVFSVFIVITVLRQVHFFWHQYQQNKISHSKNVPKGDRLGSHLTNLLYVTIWLSTIYELYVNNLVALFYAIGLILVIASIVIRIKALQDLDRSYNFDITIKSDHKLVTQGIYSVIRHPLILALMIELLGMAIISIKLWILILWLLLVVVLIRRSLLEDKALLMLGEPAKQYQKEVPAFNIFARLFR